MTETNQPITLRSVAGLDRHPKPLNESALIVIDAQTEYTAGGALALPGVEAATANIAALLNQARHIGSPVIHIVHLGRPGQMFDPAAGGRTIESVAPLPGETVIQKSLPNAFAYTKLTEALEHVGQPPLVLVGFMTHMCVSSSARAALDLGMATTVIADATATRMLPGVGDAQPVPAAEVQRSTLAALADRFSIVTDSSVILESN